MSRFKIGQDIVCVKQFRGLNSKTGEKTFSDRPIKGNTYKITQINSCRIGFGLFLLGMECKSAGYEENNFAPLESDGCSEELAETLVKHLGGKKEELQRIKI